MNALLQVTDLGVNYGARAALHGVTFELCAGETVGLVGESGSGKSTLARAILRLVRPSTGTVLWRGRDLLSCNGSALREVRRDLQIVFQDPLASLDPRMTVGESIAEPLRIFESRLSAAARRARVGEMLERVGMDAGVMHRYPHEFSGGQCQRIGIARAMMLSPRLLVCDEPVSSLDVSIQGQIVNLLLDLQRDEGTAMLFISHNLVVVRHLSHRILVMYSGTLVEIAARDVLFSTAGHPYTRALLAAVPTLPPFARADSGAERGTGTPEGAVAPASATGCAYRGRCGYALAVCARTAPLLEEVTPGHFIACHRSREVISGGYLPPPAPAPGAANGAVGV